MSNRRKTIDIASLQFYKFDKWLLLEEGLKKLSPTAKLLYMVIKDREELSLKNADYFTDSEGYLFQYFDQEKASELFGLSLTAIKKAFKDLIEYKLIESVRQGLGKPNRLYVLDYELTECTLNKLSYKNKKVPTRQSKGTEKSNVNISICDKDNINTENVKSKQEKTESKVLEVINKSAISIKKMDLKQCEEEFTDIEKLKKALEVCENNNSNGIKALRLAYKKVGTVSTKNGVNQTFEKYGKNLDKILDENQKKFSNKEEIKFINNFTEENETKENEVKEEMKFIPSCEWCK